VSFDPELGEKVSQIRALILDVDGVLTTGALFYADEGEIFKNFFVQDGQGLKLLMHHGIEVGIITSREHPSITSRLNELGLGQIMQKQHNKLNSWQKLMHQWGVTAKQCAYMGDDLPDLAIIARVGLGIAVANANTALMEHADYITQNPGGYGAVREVCDLILEVQGKLPDVITQFLQHGGLQ